MEDDLKYFLNGKQPQIYFFKWKATLNIFVNGKQPKILEQGRQY